jgi:protein-tyrosine kinase
MEKIKEALQKAKKATDHVTHDTVHKHISRENVNPEQHHEDNLNSINYVQTRTVELNPIHLEKNRIVAFNKNESSTWVFDNLRTQVLHKMQENGWKSIAVLSPTPASGKTFVAINLAISIANQPQHTAILVDFDLRKPRVAKYLGINDGLSLNDYLDGNANLSDILVNPGLQRLVILPTMRPVEKPAETLSSARVNALVNDVANRYDQRIIIYDLPPILNADDSLIMLKRVDCVLFVVGNGLVKETEIEEAMHHIPRDKLLGVVLNRAEDMTSESYYY